jgi:hypothetical protein
MEVVNSDKRISLQTTALIASVKSFIVQSYFYYCF